MKIVITNDDGIDEPGIIALEAACRDFGEVTIVAPAGPRSAISHQVTEAGELAVEERRPSAFAVNGTPADCARLALRALCPDADWLISGINAGANLGMDVYVSGTVAAVREATFQEVPSLALSQYFRRHGTVDWEGSQRRAGLVLRYVLDRRPDPDTFWSANLPDPLPGRPADEIVECALDTSPGAIGYQPTANGYQWDANYHERPRKPGADIDTCFGGRIALTRLQLRG